MRKKPFLLIVILFSIFFIISTIDVYSQPPFQQGSDVFVEGYVIEFPKFDVLQKDTDFEFNFHIFNITTGFLLTNSSSSCSFHLFIDTGEHSFMNHNIDFDPGHIDFVIRVGKGNFSNTGDYSYIIQCNDSRIGGFDSIGFEVTETGTASANYFVAVYIMIFLAWILLIIGLLKHEYTFIALSGILMTVFGVFVLINGLDIFNNTLTIAFGGIHALLGAYLMIRSASELWEF